MSKSLRIFDAHLHVDKGLEGYDLTIQGRNVIFNSVELYRQQGDRFRNADTSVTLLFDFRDDWSFVQGELKSVRAHALKIHSRIQKIKSSEYAEIARKLAQVSADIPIVIDAFYYGVEMEHQPNIKEIITLAQKFPERRFVIAHSGAHHVLDYFLHLRPLPNVYYELSAVLVYFKDSSVFADLKKLIRFTDKGHLLFGSDYPLVSPRAQQVIMSEIIDELKLSDVDAQRIFYKNAYQMFLKPRVR